MVGRKKERQGRKEGGTSRQEGTRWKKDRIGRKEGGKTGKEK